MRYKFKTPPKHGDERIITKFLLFPKVINNEFRWLEIATFKQTYEEDAFCEPLFWSDTCWINN